MANIGLSQPYAALYSVTAGAISYSGLAKLGKATTVNVTIDGKDPQILYADNGPAESLTLFGGGTVTLGIDELDLATAAKVLGLAAPASNGGITFVADAVAPYMGLGFVTKKIVGGAIKYRVVILYKVQFKTPDFSVDTQGETVSFQTPELEASILRDDATPAKWSMWQDYDTEAAALAALQTALGGT